MSTSADLASAAQAVISALVAATTDPADALRLLAKLADFAPNDATTSAPIGLAMASAQDATGNLLRRSAVIGMASVTADYEPSSQDDAQAIMQWVCGLLDDEALIAADNGEDDTYSSLISLKSAVMSDLTARGASLATVVTVVTAAPVPALTLAQRLYQDVDRADELITEANPIHPAFMPTSFKALSS